MLRGPFPRFVSDRFCPRQDARGFHRGRHAVAVGQGQRHGLLAEDLLARGGRGQDHLGVAVGLARDDDGVDGRILEQVFQVGRVAHAELGRSRRAARRVIVPRRDQRHVIILEHAPAVDGRVPVGEADHTDAEFGSHETLPSYREAGDPNPGSINNADGMADSLWYNMRQHAIKQVAHFRIRIVAAAEQD